MANLSITNVCNKKCVYCFANDTLTDLGKTYLNVETYKKSLEYLERSGLRQVRLLGGEPTLHPDFVSFTQEAIDRGFDIMLFTNGLISDKILDFLTSIPSERLTVLLNTIHPNENNNLGINRQKNVMFRLGHVILAGVNIYTPNLELDYLLEYVADYGLKKEIRLGISHSVLSQNNLFLHPKEYPKAGYNIAMFKMKAKNSGITLGFDCGFVPCMFPTEYFELLSGELMKAGNCCHPIIDLLTDGSFIACYPLNNLLKVKLDDQLNAKELTSIFEKALAPYKNVGIYPYCTTCPLFNVRCSGGCMSYRIQRYKQINCIA